MHEALPARASRSTYRISVESGVPIAAVRAALPELERRGLVEHSEGSWRRRRRSDRTALPAGQARVTLPAFRPNQLAAKNSFARRFQSSAMITAARTMVI